MSAGSSSVKVDDQFVSRTLMTPSIQTPRQSAEKRDSPVAALTHSFSCGSLFLYAAYTRLFDLLLPFLLFLILSRPTGQQPRADIDKNWPRYLDANTTVYPWLGLPCVRRGLKLFGAVCLFGKNVDCFNGQNANLRSKLCGMFEDTRAKERDEIGIIH